MKILLPIDDSDCSKATLKWAAKVLDEQKVQLYLLSIVHMLPISAEPPMVGPSYPMAGSSYEYKYEKEGVENALKEAKAMLEAQGFQIEETYAGLSGDPAYSICEYANQKKVDQIIIGSHGRTGLDKLLMGSISQKVFRDANQPVLVINNIQHQDTATLSLSNTNKMTLKTENGHIQKILIPIDGSECTKLTLQRATEFLNPDLSRISLIHVIDFMPEALTANDMAISPIVDSMSRTLTANELVEKRSIEMLEETKIYFENLGFSVIDAQYLNGKPAETICDYATENNMDQIVIGSHGRSGLVKLLTGSVAQEVFKNAKQPVILLNNVKNPSLEISHLDQVKSGKA